MTRLSVLQTRRKERCKKIHTTYIHTYSLNYLLLIIRFLKHDFHIRLAYSEISTICEYVYANNVVIYCYRLLDLIRFGKFKLKYFQEKHK